MASYIGTLANLMPVSWTESESVVPAPQYSFQDAPGKRWAFTTRRPDGGFLREWEITFSGTNRDKTVLEWIYTGAFGSGPFVYVPEGATLTNILTPAQSKLSGVANGGGVTTTSGFCPMSIVGGASVTVADKIPVVPDKPVTVSVDASGTTKMTVTFKNASGGVVASRSVSSDGVLMQRVSVTIPSVPPAARYVSISASGYTALAQPQLTWTDKAVPFESGGGASSVVISDFTPDWVMYETATGESWRDMPVKITEVG